MTSSVAQAKTRQRGQKKERKSASVQSGPASQEKLQLGTVLAAAIDYAFIVSLVLGGCCVYVSVLF